MLRMIERSPTHIIQKVVAPKLTAYQVVPKSSVGDTNAVQRFPTLFQAREAAGIPYNPQKATKRSA